MFEHQKGGARGHQRQFETIAGQFAQSRREGARQGLATAVLPLLFAVALRDARTGALAGGALALLVGISRLVLGMHSLSEVVAGWVLGALVAGFALHIDSRRRYI